jgi:membrane-associated protease RseP (regulator of RpoE activity)
MITLLAILIGIGLVVGLHEAAHMLVAKRFGVLVHKFSFGFGPRLLHKKWGETSYEIRLLPLGGFVQMHGEDPDDLIEGGFFSLPWYKRTAIALAAPVTNIVLGAVLAFVALAVFQHVPLLEAAENAIRFTYLIIEETLKWLFGLATSTSNSNDLGGPITVGKIMITSLREGWFRFTVVLSLISTSIGLFNLLPIPGLDGGHVFLYTIEGIRGKRFPAMVYGVWGLVGTALLMLLMGYAIWLDIGRL